VPSWGLSATVLEYPNLSSSNIVQIANPDSPGVISSGFTANSIQSGAQFTLEIDGKSYIVECHNTSYSFQTIESIISAINESLLEQGAAAAAYKVFHKKTQQYELAIVSNFYGNDKYIKITSSTDSLERLGLSSWNNISVYGNSGGYYLINGYVNSGFQKVLDLSGLTLDSGSNAISGANFTDYQIKKGDIINISGSEQDDGSYFVINVTSSKIYVNTNQLSSGVWLSNSSLTTNFNILRNTISFEEYNFIETDGAPNGSLFELLLDKNYNFVYRTILEYQNIFYSSNSLYSIVDCRQTNIDVSEQITFKVIGSDLYCYLDELDKKKITNYKNTYLDIFSKKYNTFIKIIIYNSDNIENYISGLTEDNFSSNIYIYAKPKYEDVLLIGNISYSSANGRIEGSSFRLPYVYDKKDTGNIKIKDIGSNAIKDLQILPMKETRSSGVVYGLEILSVNFSTDLKYLVDIAPGTAYISGKRFEFGAKTQYNTGILSTSFDKIILFINSDGIIFADSADSATCNFYINSSDNIILGTIEYNSSITQIIDQRLLINDLDLKLLNSVTVSPVDGMGHFTSINSAIKYAKRFSQLYPSAGVPEIILKAGTHRVEVDIPLDFAAKTNADLIKYYDKYGIYLDFPVKITGEGDSTVVDIITGYSDYSIENDDRSTSSINRGYIIVNGPGSTSYPDFSSDTINDGNITLSNFKLKNSTILYIDPKVTNYISYNVNFFKLKIKDIYFDWSNLIFDTSVFTSTNYFNNGYAIKLLRNSGSINDYIGNIDIHSCTFDTCYIDLTDPGYFLNVLIQNNYFYSQNEKINNTAISFLIKFLNTYRESNTLKLNISANSSSKSSIYDYLICTETGLLFFNKNTLVTNNIVVEDLKTYGDIEINSPGTFTSNSLSIFNNATDFNDIVTFNDNIYAQNIIPNASILYDLGSSSMLWKSIYARDVNIANGGTSSILGNLTIGSSSLNSLTINSSSSFTSNVSFSFISSNIIPSITGTYELGSSSRRWNTVYSNSISTLAMTAVNISSSIYAKIGLGVMVGAASNPESAIHIKQLTDSTTYTVGPGIRFESAASTDYWDLYYVTGDNFQFAWNNTVLGFLNNTGSNGQLNFTGQHKCCVDELDTIQDYKNMIGLIVVSSGKYLNTIEEKNKPTINESLPVIKLSNCSKQKSIFGVISDAEDIEKTSREYQMGIFVSVSAKSPTKDDTRVVVNSLGEGGVWVIDQGGSLENGDYITTSDVPGYGMKQEDDILRNYTVAKITQDCDFNNLKNQITKEVLFNNKKYIAAFVGCTYHCG